MALVSISKAAKLAGCARSTIYDYINTGKLSATTDSYKKTKKVETSELIRVFGEIKTPKETTEKHDKDKQELHNRTNSETQKINALEKENEILKTLLAEKDARIKDKDKHIESLDNAMRLLEDQRKKEKTGFFKRILQR